MAYLRSPTGVYRFTKNPELRFIGCYGTLLGDRDINEHDFDWIKWEASSAKSEGRERILSIQENLRYALNPFSGRNNPRRCGNARPGAL